MEESFDPLAHLGTITVQSTPEEAMIFMNGFMQPNLTPVDLPFINPGKHFIEVKMDGYKTFKEEVSISDGEEVSIDAKLEPGEDEESTFTAEENSE